MKKIVSEIRSIYGLQLSTNIAYMLQASEYELGNYFRWLWRVKSFSKLRYRKDLVRTKTSRIILAILRIMQLFGWGVIIYFILQSFKHPDSFYFSIAVAIIFGLPILISHLIAIPLLVARVCRWPINSYKIHRSTQIFSKHPGLKIVVAGSYGKTSMKEMLAAVLSQTGKIAATKGNKNVALSHAVFASSLKGDEDILIIELGEGAPGDIARFAKTIKPNIAVITGLAPAHLDKYVSLKAVAKDLMSLSKYVPNDKLYLNGDSTELAAYTKNHQTYSVKGSLGWRISKVKTGLDGTSFVMTKSTRRLAVKSRLIGLHQIGPLGFSAALASELGANFRQISAGLNQLQPVEHRMNAYRLGGAQFIDDTYNGNIEGMAAGLQLLHALPSKRKIYVTPGLVDQGPENKSIHTRLGKLIAKAEPDEVILIDNSVTAFIQAGLTEAGYRGRLSIEDDPLKFYSSLEHKFAAGDLVMMQNDWPDNYN
jgi:UDP-N-acetylmuramoyl-tripeptide--D-alanyl-D-alanine ligase